MASIWQTRIEGFRAVEAQLAAVSRDLTGPEAARAFLAGARVIQRAAQANAPRSGYPAFSRYGRKGGSSTPGLLRRSIVSFQGRNKTNPSAYAAVNVRKSFAGGARAPHGHLVEFGTRARVPKKGKRLVFVNKNGEYVFARRVAAMPAQRFFKRAVDSHSSEALSVALVKTQDIIERAVARGAR